MRSSPPGQPSLILLACTLLLAAASVLGDDDTQWLKIKHVELSLQMDVEDDMESQTAGGTHVTSDTLYLAPTAGLTLGGSIYHPNLLSFNIQAQGGYIEQDLTTTTGSTKLTSHDQSYLQNYDVSAILLGSKPYAATFTADKVHTFQELDLFNQVTVDSESYGGHLGYSAGPVPFGVTIKHLDENETGMQYNSIYQQDDAEIDAQSTRAHGSTTLSGDVGQYQQTTSIFSEQQTYQYGTLVDTEHFWQDRALLSSSGYITDESGTNAAREATVQENLTLQHSPSWNSFYNYNLNDSYIEPSESTINYGQIGVRNQLYESLASEFDVHGSIQDATAPGASFDGTLYGIGNSETYTKRLGNWGHLMLGNTVRYDLQHEQNLGSANTILNEQHVLTDGRATFLNDPLVIAVTLVTGPNGIPVYKPGIDYQVISHGDLTQIERIPTSLSLTNGATVLVDYTVQGQPSGSISTFSDQAEIRLDLFNGLASIYTSAGWVDNQSDQPFVLENSRTTQSGVDLTWRWLRAGMVYQTEDANIITYDTLGLYQTAIFQPAKESTITINGREQWSHYPQQSLSVTDYSLESRLTQQFGPAFDLSLEGGVWSENGGPIQQTLLTAGFRARYTWGKIFLSLAYQFNQEDTLNGQDERNFVSFSLRRNF